MDECHFRQPGSRLSGWFLPEEKDPVVEYAAARNRIGIIGAVRANDGTLVLREEDKFNAQTIDAFLPELSEYRDGDKTMVVILDNVRSHHAKALSRWLERHSQYFRLDFLPPYSPELSHIERIWKSIRRLCTHNQYFEQLAELRQSVLATQYGWSSPYKVLAQLCALSQCVMYSMC